MTVSENIQNLRRVKIHFDNVKDEEKGFYELMVSGMPARQTLSKIRRTVVGRWRDIRPDKT